MPSSKIKLKNQFEQTFSSIYQEIDLLANLLYESNNLPVEKAKVTEIKNNIKENMKAIEYLTTSVNI